MTRKYGWFAVLGAGLVAAAAVASCDLAVTNFGGSKVYLTMSGARPTPVGSHLELWARNGDNEIIRMTPTRNNSTAYILVPAVDINDPCMVDTGLENDGSYELIWKPEAQIGPTDAEKVTQAAAVEARIHQLTNLQPTPMVALVSYDDNAYTTPPLCASSQKIPKACTKDGDCVGVGETCSNRFCVTNGKDKVPTTCTLNTDCAAGSFCAKPCLATENCTSVCVKRKEYCNCVWGVGSCISEWSKAPMPNTGVCPSVNQFSSQIYVGDPRQLTHPIHGTFYGVVDFISSKPSQISGGMTLNELPFAVRDVRELWWTQAKAKIGDLDPDQIDCVALPASCRGNIYLQGSNGVLGRDIIHFDLTSPDRSVAGTAAIYIKLGDDPVQF